MPLLAEEAIIAANEAIFSRRSATTGSAAWARRWWAWLWTSGTCGCSMSATAAATGCANGRLEQITLDHSLVEEQVRLGRMTRSEALRSPLKNVITRALGTQSRVTPDIFELEAEPGDLFLLCSDGLTRELTDPLIESLLAIDLPLETLCVATGGGCKKSRRPRQHYCDPGAGQGIGSPANPALLCLRRASAGR